MVVVRVHVIIATTVSKGWVRERTTRLSHSPLLIYSPMWTINALGVCLFVASKDCGLDLSDRPVFGVNPQVDVLTGGSVSILV